jgi:hypothetical protein
MVLEIHEQDRRHFTHTHTYTHSYIHTLIHTHTHTYIQHLPLFPQPTLQYCTTPPISHTLRISVQTFQIILPYTYIHTSYRSHPPRPSRNPSSFVLHAPSVILHAPHRDSWKYKNAVSQDTHRSYVSLTPVKPFRSLALAHGVLEVSLNVTGLGLVGRMVGRPDAFGMGIIVVE